MNDETPAGAKTGPVLELQEFRAQAAVMPDRM